MAQTSLKYIAASLAGAFMLTTGLSACTGPSPQSQTAESQRAEMTNPYSAQSITGAANRAADWQLANMDNFEDYIPSFLHRTVEKRGWVQGAFFIGLAKWAEAGEEGRYIDWLRDYATTEGYNLGPRLYHADDHVVGMYYIELYKEDQNPDALAPTIAVFDEILANPSDVSLDFGPRTEEPNTGYTQVCLKRWCWADALFMAPPVWTQLSEITGDPKYLEFSDKEFWATYDYLYDQDSDLFLRDSRFFERREETGEKIFWSRGNGWVFSGLTMVIDSLPKNHPSYDRYMSLYKEMAAKLITVQADTGYWPVSLEAGASYPVPESSGTAFFVHGLAWGVENGTLERGTYLPSITKGWDALIRSQLDDGMIGSVQQVGYAPDKVSPNETQLYGAGAFLLAATGMLELSEKDMLP